MAFCFGPGDDESFFTEIKELLCSFKKYDEYFTINERRRSKDSTEVELGNLLENSGKNTDATNEILVIFCYNNSQFIGD